MQMLSNTVQLIGAIVTWLGLWHAYTRSRYGLGLWPWILSKLRRRGPDQTITGTGIPSAEAFGHATVTNSGDASFELDTNQSVEVQLSQLAIHVQRLYALHPSVRRDLDRLKSDVAGVRQHAETVAAQALSEAKGHTEKLFEERDAEQTQAEVLDLRVAIWGLAITVVGVLLALCA